MDRNPRVFQTFKSQEISAKNQAKQRLRNFYKENSPLVTEFPVLSFNKSQEISRENSVKPTLDLLRETFGELPGKREKLTSKRFSQDSYNQETTLDTGRRILQKKSLL